MPKNYSKFDKISKMSILKLGSLEKLGSDIEKWS